MTLFDCYHLAREKVLWCKKKKHVTLPFLLCFILYFVIWQFPNISSLGIIFGGAIYKRFVFALRVCRAYIWRGLYMNGIILGILPDFVNTLARMDSV